MFTYADCIRDYRLPVPSKAPPRYRSEFVPSLHRIQAKTAPPAGKRWDRLRDSERQVLPLFIGRVLPFDTAASQAYAKSMAKVRAAGLAVGAADGYIAATATANGMIAPLRIHEAGLRRFPDVRAGS